MASDGRHVGPANGSGPRFAPVLLSEAPEDVIALGAAVNACASAGWAAAGRLLAKTAEASVLPDLRTLNCALRAASWPYAMGFLELQRPLAGPERSRAGATPCKQT